MFGYGQVDPASYAFRRYSLQGKFKSALGETRLIAMSPFVQLKTLRTHTHSYIQDIDGKELAFQGMNRPARRYLYFRFVITYLHCERAGHMEWVQNVEAKGQMWSSPGPYLRQSLLVTLARKISDFYLPETFYQTTNFIGADGCASRSKDEEEDLAISLAVRVKKEDEMAQKRRYEDAEEED